MNITITSRDWRAALHLILTLHQLTATRTDIDVSVPKSRKDISKRTTASIHAHSAYQTVVQVKTN